MGNWVNKRILEFIKLIDKETLTKDELEKA
jgi:hypothetical protein